LIDVTLNFEPLNLERRRLFNVQSSRFNVL